MNWHEFIFSEKKWLRYTRHVVFWVAWWLCFFGSRYFYPKPFLSGQTNLKIPDTQQKFTRNLVTYLDSSNPWSTVEFTRSLLMVAIHVIACYIIIYFLLRYFLKAKYFLFLSGVILLVFAMVLTSRFVDTTVMPAFVQHGYNMPYYSSIFSGVTSAIKIIFVAVAIKLGKYWWFKQREKERLEKGKIEAELELLKAQIHPQFLFSALNNIYSFTLTASPRAPEMLLKLSDILSYMLYDCNDAEVSLKKEIKILRDYMSLEKMRYGEKLEMHIQINGNTSDDKIAPLLLLRLIDNSFQQSNNNMIEQAWINLEIDIKDHMLEMKLMNGKTPEKPDVENGEENNLAMSHRRLNLLYPGKHVLRITEEPETMIVSLQLQLTGSTEKADSLQQNTAGIDSLQTEDVLSKTNVSF